MNKPVLYAKPYYQFVDEEMIEIHLGKKLVPTIFFDPTGESKNTPNKKEATWLAESVSRASEVRKDRDELLQACAEAIAVLTDIRSAMAKGYDTATLKMLWQVVDRVKKAKAEDATKDDPSPC